MRNRYLAEQDVEASIKEAFVRNRVEQRAKPALALPVACESAIHPVARNAIGEEQEQEGWYIGRAVRHSIENGDTGSGHDTAFGKQIRHMAIHGSTHLMIQSGRTIAHHSLPCYPSSMKRALAIIIVVLLALGMIGLFFP